MNSSVEALRTSAVYAEEALVANLQSTLQKLLDSKGLTRADLARRMGVSKARITQIFSDDQNFTVRMLARAFFAVDEVLELYVGSQVPWETKSAKATSVNPIVRENVREPAEMLLWHMNDFGHEVGGRGTNGTDGVRARLMSSLSAKLTGGDVRAARSGDLTAQAANDWSGYGPNIVALAKQAVG